MLPMPARIDLTNQRFGRLTVLEYAGLRKGKGFWLCACDCGTKKKVAAMLLRCRKTTSCGCYRAELMSLTKRKHGMSHSCEWNSYSSMISRCCNVRDPKYSYYGGRGIRICAEWRKSFTAFYRDMGPRPAGTSLDRIDVNGNYEPSNCRWARPIQQARNTTRTIYYTCNGETKCLAEWADTLGVPRPTAYKRHKKGLAFEQVFRRSES
jgi:hypothetical protein